MNSLESKLEELSKEHPKGLIITGPSRAMFTAGADVNVIGEITDPQTAEGLARNGQDLFERVAKLPFPTIAAISGPCVGGGCELSLACDQRICSDHAATVVGLPETKLGILPGFGGTVRLPKLVGLSKALDIILAGKTLFPSQALACGLVDLVVPADGIVDQAEKSSPRKTEDKKKTTWVNG
jgi:3-hydroxyacyl-CoA dehydrogenase/enoyl-CoA hydratase/3-hydroxybutyryl-CoA epimerase